jgi:hypothetical protein
MIWQTGLAFAAVTLVGWPTCIPLFHAEVVKLESITFALGYESDQVACV